MVCLLGNNKHPNKQSNTICIIYGAQGPFRADICIDQNNVTIPQRTATVIATKRFYSEQVAQRVCDIAASRRCRSLERQRAAT